jgi:glycosyltransferase involved in cell wall biosynthesis
MKVLILQNKLLHYRIPLYNAIAGYDSITLTVAHPDKKVEQADLQFEQVILSTYKKGPFTLHHGLYDFCCGFDVVIAMFDIKWLTHIKLGWMRKRPFKLIYWGIGVSTEKGFDVDKKFDALRFLFAKRADALLFYSAYPIEKYKRAGFDEQRLFVAHNTVASAIEPSSAQSKKVFLFIGSLERRKKIYELIDAYHQAIQTTLKNNPVRLDIIGDGPELETIRQFILDHQLTDHIMLHGQINEEVKLKVYFEQALACISPGQAGLSVLSSFAMGVPFITRFDAITGGERLNIKNDYNGLIYGKEDADLVRILTKLAIDTSHAIEMGNNARTYYLQHRTIQHMAEGFIQAVRHVVNNSRG